MRNLAVFSALFVVLFVLLLLVLLSSRDELRPACLAMKVRTSWLLGDTAKAGSILDRHGLVLAESVEGQRRYCQDEVLAASLVHIIGDYTHNIANTVEEQAQPELCGLGRGFFDQLEGWDLAGRGQTGADLKLSLDGGLAVRQLIYWQHTQARLLR